MAEQPRRRESNPRLRPGSQPPAPQPGWRVTPAPDGRGRQPAKPPKGPNPRWLALLLIVALLALNFWVSSQVLGPEPACPDPVLADVPEAGQPEQRQFDLLDRQFDPRNVQEGDQVPGGQQERHHHRLLLDPDPVLRERHAAVQRADQQGRDDQRQPDQHRAVVPGQPGVRLRPDAAVPAPARVDLPARRGQRAAVPAG